MSWNRGFPLHIEVFSFQWVGIDGFHFIATEIFLISGVWNRGVPLFSFQCVGIERFHCI